MLSDQHLSTEIVPNNYKVYRRDRNNKKGGGVFILVRTDLQCLEPEELKTDSDTEIIWVQITVTGNSHLYVGAFYRPSNIDSPDYLASLENAIPRIPPNAHALFSSLDKGIQTDMIILDFSKAFVRVPYRRLLKKTHHYGIRGNTHKWIETFLFNRSQQVVAESKTSETVLVISGVRPRVCPGAPTLTGVYK